MYFFRKAPSRVKSTREVASMAAFSSYAFSILTAQILNSGIFETGSSALLVNLLAAASKKWNGTKTTPSSVIFETEAFIFRIS